MPSLSANLSACLDLCGGVSSTEHPNIQGQSARILNQVARMMMREARLSEQNQYLRFLSLDSPSKEIGIPSISDPNSICTVELLSDDVNDTRIDIPIVGRLELNVKEEQGAIACARFGRPTRLRFTWNPSESSDQLYVGYEVLPADADQMSSIAALPESFHDTLVYRSAALVKETILTGEMGPVFMDTMSKIEEQWSQWCRRDADERPGIKPGAGMVDYGDPMEFYV